MQKIVLTLRRGPAESFEFPEKVERSCFGSIRLFPGLPKTVSEDEYKWICKKRPELVPFLEASAYVESKRVDKRISEAHVNELAKEHGLENLPFGHQCERLKKLGLLKPKKVVEHKEPVKAPVVTEVVESKKEDFVPPVRKFKSK
jgi:hypothetical protein